MKTWIGLLPAILLGASALATDDYTLGPDSMPKEGVPKGRVEGPFVFKSQIFENTVQQYWIYVPAQYEATRPAALMVFQDGRLTSDPEARAVVGVSSGGICAFTVAWERPDAFRKVVSHIGSFTNIRGGHVYPSLIRKSAVRPIRVFLQDGSNDLTTRTATGRWPTRRWRPPSSSAATTTGSSSGTAPTPTSTGAPSCRRRCGGSGGSEPQRTRDVTCRSPRLRL